jgi:hypothetical protein
VTLDVEDFRIAGGFALEAKERIGRGLLIIDRHGAANLRHFAAIAKPFVGDVREATFEKWESLFASAGLDEMNSLLDGRIRRRRLRRQSHATRKSSRAEKSEPYYCDGQREAAGHCLSPLMTINFHEPTASECTKKKRPDAREGVRQESTARR